MWCVPRSEGQAESQGDFPRLVRNSHSFSMRKSMYNTCSNVKIQCSVFLGWTEKQYCYLGLNINRFCARKKLIILITNVDLKRKICSSKLWIQYSRNQTFQQKMENGVCAYHFWTMVLWEESSWQNSMNLSKRGHQQSTFLRMCNF